MSDIVISENGFPSFDTDFDKLFDFYVEFFEKELYRACDSFEDEYNISNGDNYSLAKAMRYSLSAGGKRIRPILCFEFCRILGGKIQDAVPACIAIEMIHTFSLIHDDLPCMDDDDYRRGRKSCHKVFGEANALLAGDALEIKAIEHILSSGLDSEKKCRMANVLSKCCYNMICGQSVDIDCEFNNVEELYNMYKNKTSELLYASSAMGAISAGADDSIIKIAEIFSYNLGMAFQIVDDILDVIGDEKLIGKPIGSDIDNNKQTSVTFKGVEGATDDADFFTENAIFAIQELPNNSFLLELTKKLLNRKK